MTETDEVYTVLVGTTDPKPESCCLLQGVGLRRNGTKRQNFRDVRHHRKFVDIQIDRQRFQCKHCGATVYEVVPGLHTGHRMTERLFAELAECAIEETFAIIGRRMGITEATVRNVFREHVDNTLAARNVPTPRVLGIDEKYLQGRPRAVLGNVEEGTLIDILPDRFRQNIAAWMECNLDPDKVEVVTMDMWHEYRTLARKSLPKAQIVVDKFHVVMKANLALESFRRKMNATLPAKERVKLKNQRKILLGRYHKLHERSIEKLERWHAQYPELADVYWLKERFYDFYEASDRAEAEKRYDRWLTTIQPEYAPFFRDLVKSMTNWRDDIFAYFEHDRTNSWVEGMNRLLAGLQDAGRGYSFDVLRAKALLAKGHQKLDSPQFIRDRFANLLVANIHLLNLPKVNYGLDIEGFKMAVGTKYYELKLVGDRWREIPMPSGLSTLETIGFKGVPMPPST